ncbi:hypothetical protein [Corynebacterium glucuronolyticum]|uniref:Uncharacterized protein n=2 Tax=Corynebacterium glucuronolyticum TaxID=39791 RepID=A0A7T4JW08_9CORY|nr:hypothetical protein [Corynebacterium glucuronolyticum]EEI62277.1 hypothetical protein HMPREF0293_2221 [Corynebacterium glucuronolyticum ATCC 51866]QQB47431.1 hypothetical protein I6I10_05975 [Corynebacterium glucuronolyticum]QRP70022.1 hypothetical protein I6J21_09550 [Corynebacterium glucuronolyticum]
MPGMDLEDAGKLVRLFVGVMSKEGVDVLEFVRERMSLVREKQSTLFELSPSDPNDADVANQVTTVVPMHPNADGGFIVVGVDPSQMEIVGAGIDADWFVPQATPHCQRVARRGAVGDPRCSRPRCAHGRHRLIRLGQGR